MNRLGFTIFSCLVPLPDRPTKPYIYDTFYQLTEKWKLASRASIVTINGSIGGGLFAIIYCKVNRKYKKKLNVGIFSAGILGGLVGITAICTACRPWQALIIGAIGSVLSCTGKPNMFVLFYLKCILE